MGPLVVTLAEWEQWLRWALALATVVVGVVAAVRMVRTHRRRPGGRGDVTLFVA